jgi:hypothetical protein
VRTIATATLFIALIASGCSSAVVPAPTPTATVPPTPAAQASPQLLPQPEPPEGLEVAPDSARLDLYMPTFSNPTQVNNPLFPVSVQESVLLLGTVDGKAFRTEVTLLVEHRIIEWAGQRIEALVSQYDAFLDGQIEEIAYDFYAQDDAGNVWYLGEEVFNFADGQITDTHGTWLAGRDAPGAMIMPAQPRLGDVYRPENAPPLVFEEVTVTAVDQTFDGPLGPVPGGIVVHEVHMDGTSEDKQFAPGYGEFFTGSGADFEALALAVPTDALGSPVPAEVAALTDAALTLIEQARAADWAGATGSLDGINAAWASIPVTETPTLLHEVVEGWRTELSAALANSDSPGAQRAAIEIARSGFDLQLRHRPTVEVDLARLDLWAAELLLHAANEDLGAVNGDMFAIDYVRDRILQRIPGADMAAIDGALEALGIAVGDEDFDAIANVAAGLRDTLATVTP